MNQFHWKSRKIVTIIVLIFMVYYLIRVKNYEYKINVLLENVPPNEIWEFVADFSNMKYLNPTIVDFLIKEDTGNYDHWKYTVEYTENLSHWPYLKNDAVAEFQVVNNLKNDPYFIRSIHKTCFFYGFYCLNSESEFKFFKPKLSNGTLCEEIVFYQCPVFLSSFCTREVVFQRNSIMNNLKRKFFKS